MYIACLLSDLLKGSTTSKAALNSLTNQYGKSKGGKVEEGPLTNLLQSSRIEALLNDERSVSASVKDPKRPLLYMLEDDSKIMSITHLLTTPPKKSSEDKVFY